MSLKRSVGRDEPSYKERDEEAAQALTEAGSQAIVRVKPICKDVDHVARMGG